MNKIKVLSMVDEDLDKAVRIKGTDYDRKRKVTSKVLTDMKKMAKKGKSYSEISEALGFSYHAVKYNLDPEFRKSYNATRDGSHVGKDKVTFKDRVAYKRQLVAEGKISI